MKVVVARYTFKTKTLK
jgi:hypothetical protein